MGREQGKLERLGAGLIGVGPGGQAAADRARKALRLGYPMIGDPEGATYDGFGFRRVLGILQQSGVVVVDRAGTVRLVHRVTNPGQALPLARVREVLEGLAGG